MATNTVDVSMSEIIGGLTLRVRFVRVARARLWLAARVIQIAACIAGCQVEVSIGDEPVESV